MNNQQSPQIQSLWEKRNNFAKSIRRQKRTQIIAEKRKILYQHHLKLLSHHQHTHHPNFTYIHIIKNIGNNINQQQLLNHLLTKLQSVNQNPRIIIEHIFDSGKYSHLVSNLDKGNFLNQTLSIFSVILARPDFQKTLFLASKGFIQILVEIFIKNIEFAGRIANIIGNICVDSDDYCDMMLQNHFHTAVFDVFGQLYDRFLSNQTNQNPQVELGMILWMLGIITGTQDSALDFTKQFDEILNFSIKLLEKRNFIKQAINIIFQLAIKNPKRVESLVSPVVNELIRQETGQTKHFEDLLHLIIKLSPGNFDYDTLFKAVLLGDYHKLEKVFIIIQLLQTQTSSKPALQNIMKDELWWQKAVNKLESNFKQTHSVLTIFRNHKLNFPCIWRFVSEHLDNQYDKNMINDVLMFLRAVLSEIEKMKAKGQCLLENLKMCNIQRKLQRLMDKSPEHMLKKIEEILFMIGHASERLKDNYGLDVEI